MGGEETPIYRYFEGRSVQSGLHPPSQVGDNCSLGVCVPPDKMGRNDLGIGWKKRRAAWKTGTWEGKGVSLGAASCGKCNWWWSGGGASNNLSGGSLAHCCILWACTKAGKTSTSWVIFHSAIPLVKSSIDGAYGTKGLQTWPPTNSSVVGAGRSHGKS